MNAWTRIPGRAKVVALATAATAVVLSVGVAQGAPGSDATIHQISLTVPVLEARTSALGCPPGTHLTGGGLTSTTDAKGYETQLSGPLGATGDSPVNWMAYIGNFFSNQDRVFKVSAICSATTDGKLAVTSFDVPSNSQASKRADCPAGSHVTGGGVTSTGPTANDKEAYDVEVSGPLANDSTANTNDGDVATHWFAYVSNLTASTQTFKVFAICSPTSDATIEAQSFTIASGQVGAATATCPSGRRALGGGIGTLGTTPDGATNSFSGYVMGYSGPVGETGSITSTSDGDVARGFSSFELNASATSQEFRSLALCASDPGPNDNPNGTPGGGPGGGGGNGTTGPVPRCAGHRATIVGTNGRNRIVGTRRADVIVALGGSDRISGGGGNDIICGGTGNDSISGGSGNDKLYGQDGKDTISGGAGDDRASGGAGNDKVSGGTGDDSLAGGSGNDKLSGGRGTDKDSGGRGKDSCSGSDKKSSC